MSAITFAIGTCVGLGARMVMPASGKAEKIPPQVWVIGIAGLFGYHFFYFTALRNAPAVEASLIAYLAVLGLGLMPVSAAFYAWDIGVKRGNIQVLGAASYAAPLLSTLVLISAVVAEPSFRILAACVLITGGAAQAAKSLLLRKPAASGARA